MPSFRPVAMIACVCVFSPVAGGAVAAEPGVIRDEGDINPLDRTYVNCADRVAAIFPREPVATDFTYTAGAKSAPARRFHVEDSGKLFSVTVANFANGPAVDPELLDAAAAPLRQRGVIRFQFDKDYDPGIPGRQLNILQPDGRQLRASVYMADHRLYITEAVAPEGDFSALQFEQSVSLIDGKGTDLDKNGTAPSRQYACRP